MLQKPYDHQLTQQSVEAIDHYYDEIVGGATRKKMYLLIGPTDEVVPWRNHEYRPEKYNGDFVHVANGSLSTKLPGQYWQRRKLLSMINESLRKRHDVVMTGEFYTREQRQSLMEIFSAYKCHTVVWLSDADYLSSVGYQTPSLDEGFEDFTYIL
tara:strand:- start:305 stop:769 length:465 start_codon:yes stop_codon:yes gene_type:complete